MIRSILLALFVLVVILPIAVLMLSMEADPAVGERPASTAEDAARTREIFREFRALSDAPGRQEITVSQSDMNSVLAFATRALPFLRGRAEVTPEAVYVALAADASRIPGGRWLNLHVVVEPSDTGLRIAAVRFGRFGVPPEIVLPLAGFALDTVLGDSLGQVATGSIDGVSIHGDLVDLGVGLDRTDRKALAGRAKSMVRDAAGISPEEDIRLHYLALEAAVDDGRLQPDGSVVPFIRHVMDFAQWRASVGNDARMEMKSALFALAIYCGSSKFQMVVGDVVPPEVLRRAGCHEATLGGRKDLRQHFVISAGLEAASDAGIAFTIGEFKELLDSNRGGSGFSFDDLAADRAGIRFATTLLDGEPAHRDRMLAMIIDEESLLPATQGLPAGLSEEEFVRRFKDVDSEAYKSVVADIDRRIDRLAVFAFP